MNARRGGIVLGLGLVGVLGVAAACGSSTFGDGSGDGGSGDGAAGDGGTDAPIEASYAAITNAASWATFDVANVNAKVRGFAGGAYDGKQYVYLAPQGTANVARYDTSLAFGDAKSWSVLDLVADVDSHAGDFVGAAFDGRYVYFSPNGPGSIARHDTTVPALKDGWSTFAPSQLGVMTGFGGAVFVAPYLYFAPATPSAGTVTLRYDTRADFAAPASWTKFDLTAANGGSGYFGGASNGKFLYYSPSGGGAGEIARFDLTASFGTAGGWSSFTLLDGNRRGFGGAAFDGTYVYFAPYKDGLLARLDPTLDPAGEAAWAYARVPFAIVPAGGVSGAGATFDGRYLYLAPGNAVGANKPSGAVTRFDTAQMLGPGAEAGADSWSGFDTATLKPPATGFSGALFDGSYVYFLGGQSGVIARFAARTPNALPPGWGTSFL